MLIFFWDPLEPQPHDPDVKALLRIAVLERRRRLQPADYIISSPLFADRYQAALLSFEVDPV